MSRMSQMRWMALLEMLWELELWVQVSWMMLIHLVLVVAVVAAAVAHHLLVR